MAFAASVALIVLAIGICLGWGWAFLKLFSLGRRDWARTATIGLAVIVAIGGILNLARIAYPWALASIAGVGFVFSFFAWRDGLRVRIPFLAELFGAAIVLFTIATQLPPRIYNFHDDFQKYFAYPVRMVETGTVFGSPLSAMGLQSMGAQAFLHGFVVAFFPIQYINGVDAVFGLLLCLALAARLSRGWVALAAVLSVYFINPQYVNISTLYLGSALMMAMAAESFEEMPSAAILGLFAAALIPMKVIYLVFAVVFVLAIALTRSKGLGWILRLGLAAGLFLAPWVLVHAPNYLFALKHHQKLEPTPAAPEPGDTDAINLFSFEPLEYGATAVNYTALLAGIVICGVRCRRSPGVIACSATAGITFILFVYVLGPMNYGYNHALRYFVPVVIALTPAVLAAADCVHPKWALALVIVPAAAFLPSLWTRTVEAVTLHTVASYSWLVVDPDYVAYNHRILDGTEKHEIQAVQKRVPPGEPILALINTPFYLNYRRNKIFDIDTAGIAVPWARMPEARYLMWDYGGFATLTPEDYQSQTSNTGANERRDSALTVEFIHSLNEMVSKGQVVYDDGEVKLVKLNE